ELGEGNKFLAFRVKIGDLTGPNSNEVKDRMLYLDEFKVYIESDFNSLINDNWDVIGQSAQTSVGNLGGDDCLYLASGGIKLNNHFPTTYNIDWGETYRAFFRFDRGNSETAITVGIGESSGIELGHGKDIALSAGYNTVEIYYKRNSNTWELYVNGIKYGFTAPSPMYLYPVLTVTNQHILLTEIKNQVFVKMTDKPDGTGIYNYSPTKGVGTGNGKNDLQFSDLNIQREIIYSFNDDFVPEKIDGEVFEDLRLWADIDYSSSGSV
ncbi:unnamed protein product, partial [marine sediment metagenome]